MDVCTGAPNDEVTALMKGTDVVDQLKVTYEIDRR